MIVFFFFFLPVSKSYVQIFKVCHSKQAGEYVENRVAHAHSKI